MVKLNFDATAHDALSWAPSDREMAAEALCIAAHYIRNEEPLPVGLKEWVADAFEIAALKPADYRAKALTDELFLTASNRRPSADWLACGSEFDSLVSSGMSKTKAAETIEEKYKISLRTARRYWKQWKAAKDEHDRIA